MNQKKGVRQRTPFRLQCFFDLFEHLSGQSETGGRRNFSGIRIVKTILENFLTHPAVEQSSFGNRTAHRIKHLFDKNRFEIDACLIQFFFIGRRQNRSRCDFGRRRRCSREIAVRLNRSDHIISLISSGCWQSPTWHRWFESLSSLIRKLFGLQSYSPFRWPRKRCWLR